MFSWSSCTYAKLTGFYCNPIVLVLLGFSTSGFLKGGVPGLELMAP